MELQSFTVMDYAGKGTVYFDHIEGSRPDVRCFNFNHLQYIEWQAQGQRSHKAEGTEDH